MSRSSPMMTPVMDEDFDLCISETNLPFPYSDHCSTGPPSLYEFNINDDDEEDEEEYEEEYEDEDDEDEEGQIFVRQVQVGNESDDENVMLEPSHPVDVSRFYPYSRSSMTLKDDLPIQLQSRLESIRKNELGIRDGSATSPSSKILRPHLSRRSYSYESNGEWHEEEFVKGTDHEQLTKEEEEKLINQEQEQQDKGLLPTVTSAVSSVAYAVGKHWSKKIYESLLRSRDPKAYYAHLLKAATNYEQWAEAAAILDQLQGKDKWKNDPRSPHYDYELLQERLSQLVSARESGDLGQMTFLLRTSLSRNLGNVGRPELYAESIIGTKRLIEDYNSEVIRQLNIICDTESDDFSIAAKLEFFTHTRQAFGRTALLLSGGATMGLIHIGVLKTLYETQLLPRIISGSSCGSIIAAILCTRTDEEIPSMLQFDKFNFTVFHTVEEQGDVLARIIHFLKNGALFDAQVLRAALKDNIGNVTFQEAYNRTRRILNVTVSTSATFEMPRLLNYLTAPNVLIWSAVATSCAAPFIYNSAPLMAKDKHGEEVQWNPSRYHWIDGSVDNDLPMNKLSELFNVNHFIVCQVNPYIVPFLQNSLARSPTRRAFGWMLYQARSELQHRLNQMSILGVMPELIHKVQAIMSQRYYGDITIVPDLGTDDYLNIVSNPTMQFMVDATLKGERATWPKISIIKNHCSIEHCLDDILYRLRLRRLEAYRAFPQSPAAVAFSKMAKNNLSHTNLQSQPEQQHQQQQRLHQHRMPIPLKRPASSVTTHTLSNSAVAERGSAAVCFGAFGRSSSSPASPTNSVSLEISRCTSPVDRQGSNFTKDAMIKGNGTLYHHLQVPQGTCAAQSAHQERGMANEQKDEALANINSLMPDPSLSLPSDINEDALTMLERPSSSKRHGYKDANGSTNNIHQGNDGLLINIGMKINSRRSSSSSAGSAHSCDYALSPSSINGSYFTKDAPLTGATIDTKYGVTDNEAITSVQAPCSADVGNNDIGSTNAPSTPVPIGIFVNGNGESRTVSGSVKFNHIKSKLTKNGSATTTTTTISSNSSSNRSKRNRSFQMTTLA
ncbi:hypothetical protein BX616_003392 [Lobosporangium transversale]|uniref:Acyl transferase/acyl hydrolase/lysophospholipase n=1 Tax=Lobosporangium transversale TaxID=64571 RepID=A0A1Y2GQJ4_9FUNG|nr:acyl transferase/acyl hydrolase/lysophospholipase [Lobosporangium transversale]KAF9898982.1 hypothetical protein BX616_003392 [Lobosporangium transversale]ORZ19134.1 acyl transferase/acyl hydrolase/lysophospholipase [Lobosporangium transversale]|eukprot:XP_021882302.1 acyl transferase/acyl hydrolase/lysophospholipase [Lobosporangium transversale]